MGFLRPRAEESGQLVTAVRQVQSAFRGCSPFDPAGKHHHSSMMLYNVASLREVSCSGATNCSGGGRSMSTMVERVAQALQQKMGTAGFEEPVASFSLA